MSSNALHAALLGIHRVSLSAFQVGRYTYYFIILSRRATIICRVAEEHEKRTSHLIKSDKAIKDGSAGPPGRLESMDILVASFLSSVTPSAFPRPLFRPIFDAPENTLVYSLFTSSIRQTQWANGNTYDVTWEKVHGVAGYDEELARMSRDGLILVAKNSAWLFFLFASTRRVNADAAIPDTPLRHPSDNGVPRPLTVNAQWPSCLTSSANASRTPLPHVTPSISLFNSPTWRQHSTSLGSRTT
ncbi:hypothetical protein NMY22_g6106 [Coprinellus aureogranulatus]|nr:hypothetical protein NMY22_g6106 [Coprinellus aureogranulatus]